MYYKRKGSTKRKPKKTNKRKSVPKSIFQQSPEKKAFYAISPLNQKVAQLNGNSNGFFITNASPDPDQGVLSTERIGCKIAVISGHWDLQFYQQSTTNQPIRGICELFYTETPETVSSTTASSLYNGTPFILSGGSYAGIIDYNSDRDFNYMKNYKRVCYKKFKVAADTLSTQVQITTIKMGFRAKKPYIFRFTDTASTQTTGQFIFVVRCDAGNYAGGDSTLSGVPILTAATGLVMNYQHTTFYYDN